METLQLTNIAIIVYMMRISAINLVVYNT